MIEGVDLTGLRVFPGLVNSHDHLEFALFPQLGNGIYPNAAAWARDIHHPDRSPVREHLLVPKRLRLLWGGLRNLAAGVTTVSHHNPYDPCFDEGFPVRVVERYGWSHSFSFGDDVAACHARTPAGAPFLIHLGEGTDQDSADEIFRLRDIGALDKHTVLVHAVGLNEEGWRLVRESGASVVWCPRSNCFTLGRTLPLPLPDVPLALGTDSPLTAEGDLLDEIRVARNLAPAADIRAMVSSGALRILRLVPYAEDWVAAREFGEPPELVVVAGHVHLINARLARSWTKLPRDEFFPLRVAGRPEVLVRWNIPRLIAETQSYLGDCPLRLAGREVSV